MILPQRFYSRRPDEVARELLGKRIVRVVGESEISGFIVETEAYFGPEDPASRARKGGDLARVMMGDVGIALVYGIHRQWLLNVVAHEEGEAGAVLIRSALSSELISGPGRVTRFLMIDKSFHGKPVYEGSSELRIEEGLEVTDELIVRRKRIGVKEDLEELLNFSLKVREFLMALSRAHRDEPKG